MYTEHLEQYLAFKKCSEILAPADMWHLTPLFILCFLEPFSLIFSLALFFPNFPPALIVFHFLKEASLAFKGYGCPRFHSRLSAPRILFMT